MPPTPATNSRLCRRIGEPEGNNRYLSNVPPPCAGGWVAGARKVVVRLHTRPMHASQTLSACARAACSVHERATAQGTQPPPSQPPDPTHKHAWFGRTPNKAPHSAESRRTEYAPHVLRAKVGDHCTSCGGFVDHRILWRLSREGAERVRSAHRGAAPARLRFGRAVGRLNRRWVTAGGRELS